MPLLNNIPLVDETDVCSFTNPPPQTLLNLPRPGRCVPHEPEPRRHSVGRHPLLWPTVCLGCPLSKAESHLGPRPTGEPPDCRRSDCSHVMPLSVALLCVCFHYHVSRRLYVFAEYNRQYAGRICAHVLLQCWCELPEPNCVCMTRV